MRSEEQRHHHHGHEHGHNHEHPAAETFEELRSLAIESLLIEKGFITEHDVDKIIEKFVTDTGPMKGAKLIAKAWVDPAFKEKLLKSGKQAAADLGLGSLPVELYVLENTPGVHNMVVCTLCSCYPSMLLGLPPSWYKSTAYRSRCVIDPRGVLLEFGVELDESVEIRVWDSNAEVRYLVLPERPEGSERMTEEELAALVTRDSMIGTAVIKV